MPTRASLRHAAARMLDPLCSMGLWLGTLCFAASLTPSLIPRDALLQGVLSGIAFAAGYGVGVLMRWLWIFLGLPRLRDLAVGRVATGLAVVVCAAMVIGFLAQASGWQNDIRARMGMEAVASARPVFVGLVAGGVALVLLLLGRLFGGVVYVLSQRLGRHLPRRVSLIVSVALAGLLFWSIGNGVVFEAGLRALDSSYRQLDSVVDTALDPPLDPLKTGSEASLLGWSGLGRMGRAAVAAGPTQVEIEALSGQPAQEPLRIYVGLNSAPDIRARAELALAEMIRVGAFERSTLVINTPTGTGWLDPASQKAMEYLQRGDVATVSMQYSYLASWLALMVDPTYGADSARALFAAVHGHWRTLPRDQRPRLYLHGLSLGALNSDLSVDLFDIIGEPFDGALWAGPPFPSRTWRHATLGRDPATPAWRPRYRDGSVVRFMTQDGAPAGDAAWGGTRIVYLQYPSDPITFFEAGSALRRPDWLAGPRADDVSDSLRWFPLVTFLQLGMDMAVATSTPTGYGHVFAADDYVDAWIATTGATWDADSVAALKATLAAEGL
ncbi:alpha/beta-hydrolase family protein [Luteimonas fraxinea]|uniref:alpha/beta hydrolase n=1 Tax=Luteimonas fraxinea TaxID=2901869 RepID=UPI001E3609BE|nr:alpha/beta-hydrolase family protein [Luteimonas fraxinea]MCD9127232.1 alpha/beta-hydrolase family protein [Luteimonas fraxinea]UHH10610.1 alpha/beta-hydrolase family protein [Luteimonas fraxinea]